MQQFKKTRLAFAFALPIATFGCNKTPVEPKLPVAKPIVHATADGPIEVENVKAQSKKDSTYARILKGAREFVETRALFQDLNGSITGMKVLATYTCSGTYRTQNGSSKEFKNERSLCGVTTKDINGEQFIVLHMKNINGTWHPMSKDLDYSKYQSAFTTFYSKTKPTIAEIVEQTLFSDNRTTNGTNWNVDNQILFQEDWEKYIVGNPPSGFIASKADGG